MFKVRSSIVSVGLVGIAAMLHPGPARADQHGHASWYSLPENITANGEQMDPGAMTAAHRSLPFGTRVLVENLTNGRTVVVRINDRGPFVGGRIIDLSKGAAASIDMVNPGIAKVRVSILTGQQGPSRIPATPDYGLIEASAQGEGSAKMAAADLPAPKRVAAKAVEPTRVAAKSSEPKPAATKTPEPKRVAAKDPKPKRVAVKTTAPKQAAAKRKPATVAAKAKPSRATSKASHRQVASAMAVTPKRGTRRAIAALAEPAAKPSRESRKQVASITGAARAARSLRGHRDIVVATRKQKAPTVAARQQKKKNPYAILADAPAFLKTASLSRRKATRSG